MKRAVKYLFALVLVFLMVSCEKGFMKNETFVPEVPELSFNGENSIVIGKTGGEFTFSFKSNLPWIIENNVDWITVDGADRGEGSADPIEIRCIVAINKSLTPRSTTIKVRIDDEHQQEMQISQLPMLIEDLGNHMYVKVDGKGDGSSWDKAMNLTEALGTAMDGDIIHIAAGIYKPEKAVQGSNESDPKNNAFHLAVNATLVGGYPADAGEGAEADPVKNQVVLTGSNTQYRVLVVSAMKDKNFTATVKGVTIKEGAGAGSPELLLNGAKIRSGYGAGIAVAGSNFILENCSLLENKSKCAPAMYNSDGANTLIDKCIIANNKATANGANIWNSYATLTIKDSQLLNNSTSSGVGGGVYIHGDSGMPSCPNLFYCYNTLFENNATDGGRNSRRGGGIYAREGSKSVIANCTFKNNFGGNGAAISLYGTAAKPSEMTLISCTVTQNHSTFNGCVEECANTTMKVYNSIISGNVADGGSADAVSANGALPSTYAYSINGNSIYNVDGAAATGNFDAKTMFGAFSDNVFRLVGDGNPARTMGMPVMEFNSIVTGMKPEVDYKILAEDQNNKERTGAVMGASVE